MTIPYTYLLKHKPTGHLYYGVRWARGCHPDEFWKTYFTSSKKLVPLYRTIYGDDCWEFEIRRTFKTPNDARVWEEKVLRRMRVLKKPELWLNRTNNKAILNEVSPRSMLGKKASIDTRNKMSNRRRGVKKTEVHRQKIGQAHVGMKRTERAKQNMVKAWTIERRAALADFNRRGRVGAFYEP